MSAERDELAGIVAERIDGDIYACTRVWDAWSYGTMSQDDFTPASEEADLMADVADAILAAGYRKIFDGDCGLGQIEDHAEREAAEAWMRWANLVNTDGGERNGIAAMKQMLTEFGYRKPRTISTAEELTELPDGTVVRDKDGDVFERRAGDWCSYETSPLSDKYLSKYLPVEVLA